jgi:uncharacterized protein (TIGR02594 family)
MLELKTGDQGTAVQIVQTLLNSYLVPSPNLLEDGDFGPGTREAVIRFQKPLGIPPNGTVGRETWFRLGLITINRPMPAISSLYPWMRVAHAELLIHENSIPGQNNARIVEYHQTTTLKATDDETPWCSAFVNWVLEKAGYSGTGSAAAKSWLDWGTKLTEPREGAISVVKQKAASTTAGTSSGFHVAFLVSASPSILRLLGGNQSNAVRFSDFSTAKWEVQGYRWP